MRHSAPLVLLVLAGCTVENDLTKNDLNGGGFDSGDSPPVFETGDSDTTPPLEVCDGIDNDEDGSIDEGFADSDKDGVADCMDSECSLDLGTPKTDQDDECSGGVTLGDPPANPWNAEIFWQWTAGSGYATPAVGDLDKDGVPEVVATLGTPSYFPGSLIVFDGATGDIEGQLSDVVDATGGVALGDIDGDGYGDIVTYNYSGARTLAAYDRDLNLMWEVSTTAREENYPVITDLEGDGSVEVVANDQVIEGATGNVLVTLSGAGTTWGANAVADLDGDGRQEIMLENGVYDADGTKLWTCASGTGAGTFPQPVNADGDDEGEVLVAGPGKMALCDDDGTLLWTRTYGNYGTAVAVADFDADGVQEYAFAETNQLLLLEPDGSVRWTAPMTDASGLSGTTSWDIDMDGRNEVIFADEQNILVYNGATGAIELTYPEHASVTLAETPAVADVDGDGHGDLIYASNGTSFGLTVIRGADGDWPYSRPVYNQYTYYGANINDDLSVPTDPEPPWLYIGNLFRGQPSALYVGSSPNLRARITDVCAASCETGGAVQVAAQVWNDGGADVVDALVNLYSYVDGAETRIAQTTVASLPTATSSEIVFDVLADDLGTDLWVIVDPDDAEAECHEDDNRGEWIDLPCW